jgi:ATP-dependent protease ClpP protease subunit
MKRALPFVAFLALNCAGAQFKHTAEHVASLYGPITSKSVTPVVAVLAIAETSVDIDISSSGGSIPAAEAVIRAMNDADARGVQVVCIVNREAASAAFVVLQGCPVRVARKGAWLMMHRLYYGHLEKGQFVRDEPKDEDARRVLAQAEAEVARFISARLGITVDEYEARVADADWTMSASEALKFHAVDQVVP